jgi:hypothetical protein
MIRAEMMALRLDAPLLPAPGRGWVRGLEPRHAAGYRTAMPVSRRQCDLQMTPRAPTG